MRPQKPSSRVTAGDKWFRALLWQYRCRSSFKGFLIAAFHRQSWCLNRSKGFAIETSNTILTNRVKTKQTWCSYDCVSDHRGSMFLQLHHSKGTGGVQENHRFGYVFSSPEIKAHVGFYGCLLSVAYPVCPSVCPPVCL